MASKTAHPNLQLSIIVTVHAEGILMHKTLASINRAVELLIEHDIAYELIIHSDNPTTATTDYLVAHANDLQGVQIFTNHFGDLGSSRNFAIQQAKGKYVTFIDADDLMSQRWLYEAYAFLQNHELGQYVAHTEKTVEFGGANSVVIKHGEINQATDTLLSVYANRWNSIIMAPRELLLVEPYTANSPGFGYEDWHLNCRLIARGIHNVLIPETVIFVRRKLNNSEWARQISSRSVLRANPLLSFANIRQLPEVHWQDQQETATHIPSKRIQRAKAIIQRVPQIERYARKLYALRQPKNGGSVVTGETRVPQWLVQEWRALHIIEKQLFPSAELIANVTLYDSLSPEHIATGRAYKKLIEQTRHNKYDYILFVPWLIKGGADLFAINYCRQITDLRPDKRILVIATLNQPSDWSDKLPESVDFMDFGTITAGLSQEVLYRLLEQIIENSQAGHLHIINSELAYNFVESHQPYLQATKKQLTVTSFSQSTDTSGRVFGYSHSHVPHVYDAAQCITTDNQAVADMWQTEYGFEPSKILIHHQPVEAPQLSVPKRPIKAKTLRVLWAARLAPEKQPQMVAAIGRLVETHDIQIDMYGHADKDFDQSFLNQLPGNVRYNGSFDGFYKLPLDTYDVYLYTSLFDGMPNAILEAAAANIPIVSSAVGGIPDLISDRVSGRLISALDEPEPYAQALIDLLQQPEQLAEYSAALAKTLASRHDPEAYRQNIELYLRKINY